MNMRPVQLSNPTLRSPATKFLRSVPSFRVNRRAVLAWVCLVLILALQGFAITESYIWAVPLICLLAIALSADIPLVPAVGVTLLVRVLTDNTGSTTSRHSASLNLGGLIAALLILLAIGLLQRRRQGLVPALATWLWLGIWTAIAAASHGASTVTIREGVREASIVAVAVIVYNSYGKINVSTATLIIQLTGLISAVLAIHQLATHGGMLIDGEVRANGTFSHPNGAALFFALAVMASLWRYLALGHHRVDAAIGVVYGIAAVATFSLGGLASLLAMLLTFSMLQRGGFVTRFGVVGAAILITGIFIATPLGAERIASESSTQVGSFQVHNTSHSSLAWRFYKWETLIPEWEKSPFIGSGLGTTVAAEGTSENKNAGILPHSEYVRYLVETGALGMICIVGGLFILFRALSRRHGAGGISDPGKLGIAITVGFLINALAANTLLYTPAAYAAALILAAVLASPGADHYSPTITDTTS
jgi:hypothetical protein